MSVVKETALARQGRHRPRDPVHDYVAVSGDGEVHLIALRDVEVLPDGLGDRDLTLAGERRGGHGVAPVFLTCGKEYREECNPLLAKEIHARATRAIDGSIHTAR